VGEDLPDHRRVFDTGDDAHGPATGWAARDLDAEDPFEALRLRRIEARRSAVVGSCGSSPRSYEAGHPGPAWPVSPAHGRGCSAQRPRDQFIGNEFWPLQLPREAGEYQDDTSKAGAEAALLAAESDQVLGVTGIAAHPQKAVLEAPALEVSLQLLRDIRGEVRALRSQVRLERRVVFLDDLIEERALRAVTQIRRRPLAQLGFRAGRQRQHDRILAKSDCGSGYQAQRPSWPAQSQCRDVDRDARHGTA